MSDTTNASAQDGALAESGSDPVQPTGMGRLEEYYQSLESDEFDNSTPNDDAEGEQPAEPAEGEEEPAAPAEGDEAPADDQAAADADALEEEANFKALEDDTPKEYLTTADAIKEKFPRNSSNELVALTAEYGEKAQKHDELLTAIGGERFVPGMSKIAEALKENNPGGIFEGIVETSSVEGLAEVIGQAIFMGAARSDHMMASDDPVAQALGKATKGMVEAAMAERFGTEVTLEQLDLAAKYIGAGWFEKIEKWTAENYIPKDELDELLESTTDPELAAIKAENKALKERLEGKDNESAKADNAARALQVENSFDKLVNEQIESTLNDIIWKTSVVRDLASDSADLKADKALIRATLLEAAQTEFQRNQARRELLEGYGHGKANTAVYGTNLAKAIDKAILATKERTSQFERILARRAGAAPNSRLARPSQQQSGDNAGNTGDGNGNSGLTPTQTDTGQPRKLTTAEIQKNLEARIAAFEQGQL